MKLVVLGCGVGVPLDQNLGLVLRDHADHTPHAEDALVADVDGTVEIPLDSGVDVPASDTPRAEEARPRECRRNTDDLHG